MTMVADNAAYPHADQRRSINVGGAVFRTADRH